MEHGVARADVRADARRGLTKGVVFAAVGAVLAAVSFALVSAAPGHAGAVEALYSRGVYPLFAQPLSTLFGLLPFSLAELTLVGAPLWIGGGVALYARSCQRRGISAARMAGRLALFFVGLIGCLYALYAGGWQLNYHRAAYADIAGLEVRPSDKAELRELCASLIAQTNALRAAIPETPEGTADVGTARMAIAGANAAWENAGERYPWLKGRYGSAKPVVLSEQMSYMGIAGIYIPITFEANVNALESPYLIASAAAHEQAHMRGFAREDEANYIAYAVTQLSDDPRVQYAGSLLALIHTSNALSGEDADAWARLYGEQSEGVRRDLDAHGERWRKYEGPVQEAHAEVNDAYLRYNKQEDGVKSYGRMVDLLLAEKRRAENER